MLLPQGGSVTRPTARAVMPRLAPRVGLDTDSSGELLTRCADIAEARRTARRDEHHQALHGEQSFWRWQNEQMISTSGFATAG